ncbi:MAG: BglG family transcription antiterminator [Cellulosilyticaceae bacterium]
MKDIERLLILYIESNDGYTACSTLATYLNVSERSIKRYIKHINELSETYGAYIETIKGLGYKLVKTSPKVYEQYIVNGKKAKASEQAITLQLMQCLLLERYSKLDALEEKLYASRSTLQSALNEVKKWLEKYSLTLAHRPHYGMYIEGDENAVRRCMAKYFFEKDQGKEVTLHTPFGNIHQEKINAITKLLEHTVLQAGKLKNEYEMVYLTKLIAVSCYRMSQGCFIKDVTVMNESDEAETSESGSFQEVLETICEIKIPKEEMLYISMVSQIEEGFKVSHSPSYEEIREIVRHTLDVIEDKYKVRLRQDAHLLESLSTHVYNGYSRYYFGLEVENIALTQIKKSYPEAFHYALELKEALEQKLEVTINRKELGYIAVHFATTIEKAREVTRYGIYIICDTGFGMTELIRTKLKRFFSEIEVLGACQVHAVRQLDMDKVDFILATTKLDKEIEAEKDVVYISHILHEKDIEAIEYELGKLYLENYLKALFDSRIFYPTSSYKTKEEVLQGITGDMLAKGFITLDDQDEIFKREQVASTEISDLVAVPHCICLGETNTIGICTLKSPILWGTARVKLVMVACLNIDVVQNKHVFPFLHSRIQKASVVNKLCECQTLEEWLHLLMERNSQ